MVVMAEVPVRGVNRARTSPAREAFAGIHAALVVSPQPVVLGVVATFLPRSSLPIACSRTPLTATNAGVESLARGTANRWASGAHETCSNIQRVSLGRNTPMPPRLERCLVEDRMAALASGLVAAQVGREWAAALIVTLIRIGVVV